MKAPEEAHARVRLRERRYGDIALAIVENESRLKASHRVVHEGVVSSDVSGSLSVFTSRFLYWVLVYAFLERKVKVVQHSVHLREMSNGERHVHRHMLRMTVVGTTLVHEPHCGGFGTIKVTETKYSG